MNFFDNYLIDRGVEKGNEYVFDNNIKIDRNVLMYKDEVVQISNISSIKTDKIRYTVPVFSIYMVVILGIIGLIIFIKILSMDSQSSYYPNQFNPAMHSSGVLWMMLFIAVLIATLPIIRTLLWLFSETYRSYYYLLFSVNSGNNFFIRSDYLLTAGLKSKKDEDFRKIALALVNVINEGKNKSLTINAEYIHDNTSNSTISLDKVKDSN